MYFNKICRSEFWYLLFPLRKFNPKIFCNTIARVSRKRSTFLKGNKRYQNSHRHNLLKYNKVYHSDRILLNSLYFSKTLHIWHEKILIEKLIKKQWRFLLYQPILCYQLLLVLINNHLTLYVVKLILSIVIGDLNASMYCVHKTVNYLKCPSVADVILL